MKVFISYRRNDTQDLAGRIADRLKATRGIQRVFIDVDGIEPGADFAKRIDDAIAASDVCIVLIGPRWLGERADGRIRIIEDTDFVRREASAALACGQRVLPVLANGAQMPEAMDLPEELRGLPAINASSIRHAYFEHDFRYLVDALLSRKKPGRLAAYRRRHPVQATLARSILGAIGALAALTVAAAVHHAIAGRSLEESLGDEGHVWLLIAGVAIAGAAAAAVMPALPWRASKSNSNSQNSTKTAAR